MGVQPIITLTRTRSRSIPNVGRATFVQIPISRVGLRGRDRHIRVFKKRFRRDAPHSVRGFHQVVTRAADVFVTERVGKGDRFGELPGAHQEAGAIHIPISLTDHDYFLTSDLRSRFAADFPGPILCWSGVTLRAESDAVNYT